MRYVSHRFPKIILKKLILEHFQSLQVVGDDIIKSLPLIWSVLMIAVMNPCNYIVLHEQIAVMMVSTKSPQHRFDQHVLRVLVNVTWFFFQDLTHNFLGPVKKLLDFPNDVGRDVFLCLQLLSIVQDDLSRKMKANHVNTSRLTEDIPVVQKPRLFFGVNARGKVCLKHSDIAYIIKGFRALWVIQLSHALL